MSPAPGGRAGPALDPRPEGLPGLGGGRGNTQGPEDGGRWVQPGALWPVSPESLTRIQLPPNLVLLTTPGAAPAAPTARQTCGRRHKKRSFLRPRIIGGSSSLPGSHPWLAAIYVGDSFCAGSLVHTCWVVSAAHCFSHRWALAPDPTRPLPSHPATVPSLPPPLRSSPPPACPRAPAPPPSFGASAPAELPSALRLRWDGRPATAGPRGCRDPTPGAQARLSDAWGAVGGGGGIVRHAQLGAGRAGSGVWSVEPTALPVGGGGERTSELLPRRGQVWGPGGGTVLSGSSGVRSQGRRGLTVPPAATRDCSVVGAVWGTSPVLTHHLRRRWAGLGNGTLSVGRRVRRRGEGESGRGANLVSAGTPARGCVWDGP